MIAVEDKEINKIVSFLRSGKALIIKTDTVWGLLSTNQKLLYQIKNRPISKLFVRLVDDCKLLHNLKPIHKEFINTFWPGDVTIIKDNISYRMPNDKLLLTLVKYFPVTQPLFLTSANLHGGVTIKNYKEAATTFNQWCDWCIFVVPTNQPIDRFQNTLPSTIVDIDQWKILRRGNSEKEIVIWIYNNVILPDKLKHIETHITNAIDIKDDDWNYTTSLDFFEKHEYENIQKQTENIKKGFFANLFSKKKKE